MKSESQQEDKQSSKVKGKEKKWQVADRGKWTEEQLLIQRWRERQDKERHMGHWTNMCLGEIAVTSSSNGGADSPDTLPVDPCHSAELGKTS